MTKRGRNEEHASFAYLKHIKFDPLGLFSDPKVFKKHREKRAALDISNAHNFTRDDFVAIGNEMGSALLNLNMSYNKNLTDNDVYATLGLPATIPLPLRSVDLSFTSITDSCIESIAMYAPRLRVVNLKGCFQITDLSLSALAKHCKELTNLKISACPLITDRGLQLFAQERNSNLRTLHFAQCVGITDLSVPYLVQYCRLISNINLSYTSISPEGVKVLLSSLPVLTRCGLEGMPIGDQHIDVLTSVYKLNAASQVMEVLIFGINELSFDGFRKFVF